MLSFIDITYFHPQIVSLFDGNLNFYSLYRWAMLGITLFNVFNVVVSILKYKKYFDRLPFFLQRYLKDKTKKILGSKITESRQEIQTNLSLLGVLIILNIVLFFI